MAKKKKKNRKIQPSQANAAPQKIPFIEHLLELRRRMFYIVVTVLVGSLAAYSIEHRLINILLRPAHGQHFIYTSPIGGVDFLFRLTLYTGLIIGIPVIVYQLLRYIEPLISEASARFIAIGSTVSGILAAAGVVFGYFIGLPSALHFLSHQFVSAQIQPMVTIQSYMSFVLVYMVGSALLFQLPLILIFINRIKPLKPKSLLHQERWVVALAFIISGLMNPTPNIFALLLVAGPIIIMYQVGIVMIAMINHQKKRPAHVVALLASDRAAQAERRARLKDMQTVWRQASNMDSPSSIGFQQHLSNFRPSANPRPRGPISGPAPEPAPPPPSDSGSPVFRTPPPRPQKYLDGFIDFHRANTA